MESNSTIFDATKITKYWKNQTSSFGDNFVDPLFPPSENSLLAKDSNGNFIDTTEGEKKATEIASENIEWKRAGDIFSKYLIFDEKIEFSDIKQGTLGNCYFLSAIAALTEKPKLIYQLFRTKEVDASGYYEVVLFIDGEWTVIPLDDYFPVYKDRKDFPFSKPNGNELWVILLEKAWAKVNGGYANTISGYCTDALSALTGFASQRLGHKEMKPEDIWQTVLYADQSDNIMCTSTIGSKEIKDFGLVDNHAYTLIGAKEVNHEGNQLRLLKIRNPWGHREWNGDWSDASPLWTDELRHTFGNSNSDDGTFFMSFEDFLKLFQATHVCYVMYDAYAKSFEIGGDDLSRPHIYNLYLPEESTISISAIKRHWRFNREIRNLNHPLSLVIAKWDSATQKFSQVDGQYSAQSNVEMVHRALSKGVYLIWVHCPVSKCQDPKPEKFFLRFLSPVMYNAEFKTFDDSFDCIKEVMKAGCREKHTEEIDQKETGFIYGNSFNESGIGYVYMHNKSPTTYLKITHFDKGFQALSLLPPYEGMKEFSTSLAPEGEDIVLGIRYEQYSSYWFNLSCTYYTHICEEGTDPTNYKPVDLSAFVSESLQFEEISNSYYDYVSSSYDSAAHSLIFQHLDLKEIALEELQGQHPDLMAKLLCFTPLDNSDGLIWKKVSYDNGFYVGECNQKNERHGRGAYYWTGSSYYVGYWIKGSKEKFGKFYKNDMSLTYEGEMGNNKKNGLGTYYYGDEGLYKGNFVNDLKEGPGTYHWGDGGYWQGQSVNGQLKGKGMYYAKNGNSWEVEY